MNGVATFRLCKLSNDELIKKVDSGTDEMYQTGKIPTRNIPARPDEDYDLLVGEMIYRFDEQSARIRELEGALENADRFIRNGVEFGYIELPAAGDPAHNTIDRIKQALNKTKPE